MTETPTVELDAPPDDSEKLRYLTEAQWAEIVVAHEMGELTATMLAAKYDVSVSGISKGLKKRGAVYGRLAHEKAAKVAAATTASAVLEAVDAASDRSKRIEETKRDHYNWSTMLAKLAMSKIAKAERDKVPLASIVGDLRALRQAEAIVRGARTERYVLLDMEGEVDEKDLPDLTIRDLTDQELDALRARNDDDDGLLELPVIEIEDVVLEGE